jgi:glutaredoxin 3
MRSRSGRGTVPQVFIGDKYVGDCDDLHALDAAGRLDAMLKSTGV